MFKNIFKRKFLLGFIAFVIVGGGYWIYSSSGAKPAPRYMLAAVSKGAIISTVSASGQVSAVNQVDIKAKASGDVIYINAVVGQEVKNGAVLAGLDSADAQKAVRDAKIDVETAQLELDSILAPADVLTLLQAENSLIQLQTSKQNAVDDLVKARENGFNAVQNAFLDLPAIMTDLDNILYDDNINKSQENVSAYADLVRQFDEARVEKYKKYSIDGYAVARAAYDQNFADYKTVNRNSADATIENLIDQTYETSKKISEAVKNIDDFIAYVKDTLTQQKMNVPSAVTTHQALIRTHISGINGVLSDILSTKSSIANDRDSIASADRSLAEKTLSMEKLKAGADELTIRAKRLALRQKQDALLTAQQKLADYIIRAPFDGVVSKMEIKKADSVSTGAIVANFITKQKMAEISLNEIDAAKVKVGQKVNLTFDALPELNITGEVAETDTLGTVTQGVVTYAVKIVFDTQDERVKSGMSISASVIIDIKQDVLMVPNSAVKSANDGSLYVETPAETVSGNTAIGVELKNPPQRVQVQTGIANDSFTEIVSGLKESDNVISRTVTATVTAATQGQSLFQFGGSGNRTGGATGGAARVPTAVGR
jgi:multidrug efflux pump subunit AcrA (membrane-fusion protein)